MVNTTKSISGGPPRGTREPISAGTAAESHVVNTVENTLEPPAMQYVDEESEIVDTRGGDGWYAELEAEDGLKRVPLVAWVDLDDANMYGLIVDESTGRVSKSSVEEHPGFIRYSK